MNLDRDLIMNIHWARLSILVLMQGHPFRQQGQQGTRAIEPQRAGMVIYACLANIDGDVDARAT